MQAASAELDKVSQQFSNYKITASCQVAAEHDKGRALTQEVAELKAQLTCAEDGRVTAEGFMKELQKSQAAHESALALKVDHVLHLPPWFSLITSTRSLEVACALNSAAPGGLQEV